MTYYSKIFIKRKINFRLQFTQLETKYKKYLILNSTKISLMKTNQNSQQKQFRITKNGFKRKSVTEFNSFRKKLFKSKKGQKI